MTTSPEPPTARALAEHASAGIVIRNSRFIAEAFPVASADEARERLRLQKERYADATHVVHAFVTGPTGGTCGCSDDGEPSGTSGRPTLEVLKGSGITDILLTTTRYFGGVKLGTGGLVKAYTEAAQQVLANCRAVERVPQADFLLAVAYPHYEQARRLLLAAEADITAEDFAGEVTLSGRLRLGRADALRDALRDLTRGQAQLELLDEDP